VVEMLERHVETFLLTWRREIRRVVWRIVRAGLVAGGTFFVIGGVVLTGIILTLRQSPVHPLALVSYTVLLLAAVATAMAATAFALSAAVMRGIERAAHQVLAEARRIETEVTKSAARAVAGVGESSRSRYDSPALPRGPGNPL